MFPALLAAQRPSSHPPSSVDRQLVAAGIWAEARYNYAYWDAVRANWDSASPRPVTYVGASPRPTDLQFFRRLRRWGALLDDGQLEILPPGTIAGRVARPPLICAASNTGPSSWTTRSTTRCASHGLSGWRRSSRPGNSGGDLDPRLRVARDRRGHRGEPLGARGRRNAGRRTWYAVHLLLRLPGGAERGASVTRSVPLTARSVLARPPAALEADTLADGAIWIRVNSLPIPLWSRCSIAALGDAPREGPRHRGLILDLRETTWTAGGREQGMRCSPG